MNQSYCYSFRFCCDPGFNDRREIASLRRFVREAQIAGVAVFCNVEELNTGCACSATCRPRLRRRAGSCRSTTGTV